jgi:hypothetical protein
LPGNRYQHEWLAGPEDRRQECTNLSQAALAPAERAGLQLCWVQSAAGAGRLACRGPSGSAVRCLLRLLCNDRARLPARSTEPSHPGQQQRHLLWEGPAFRRVPSLTHHHLGARQHTQLRCLVGGLKTHGTHALCPVTIVSALLHMYYRTFHVHMHAFCPFPLVSKPRFQALGDPLVSKEAPWPPERGWKKCWLRHALQALRGPAVEGVSSCCHPVTCHRCLAAALPTRAGQRHRSGPPPPCAPFARKRPWLDSYPRGRALATEQRLL